MGVSLSLSPVAPWNTPLIVLSESYNVGLPTALPRPSVWSATLLTCPVSSSSQDRTPGRTPPTLFSFRTFGPGHLRLVGTHYDRQGVHKDPLHLRP